VERGHVARAVAAGGDEGALAERGEPVGITDATLAASLYVREGGSFLRKFAAWLFCEVSGSLRQTFATDL
jgi:hypothetical protein